MTVREHCGQEDKSVLCPNRHAKLPAFAVAQAILIARLVSQEVQDRSSRRKG